MWYPVAVNAVMLTLFSVRCSAECRSLSVLPVYGNRICLPEPSFIRDVLRKSGACFCFQWRDSVIDLPVGKHGLVDRMERHVQLSADGAVDGRRMADTPATENISLNR